MAKRRSKRIGLFPAAVVLVVLLLVFGGIKSGLFSSPELNGGHDASADLSDYGFVIDFINVGQGDCELLRSGDTTLLIDGGEAAYSQTVIRYLRSRGVTKIDAYILTHPHSDHIGAAARIMNNFAVGTVLATAFSDENIPATAWYENALDAVESRAGDYVEVTAGDKFTFGDMKIRVVCPFAESEDYNDMSVGITVSCGGTTALFCGDASSVIEQQILTSGYDIKADIFKVSHHGSSTANSRDFLEAVDPSVCVISCGSDNAYGHPHRETLENLGNMGIRPYRTDENGNITAYCKGGHIEMRTEK